ncbi:MAG: DoxX family protein [Candidatus Sulfotelmatobacter sp.]
MQRLYSTFPGGWPGMGLLLLRLATGVTLITQGFAYLPELQELNFGTWVVCLLALASGSSLLVGLLTPFASALSVLGSLGMTFLWLPAPNYNLFKGNPFSFDVLIMAMACALLGPGAFSLDAHLFGRRKIIIPRPSSSHSPKA